MLTGHGPALLVQLDLYGLGLAAEHGEPLRAVGCCLIGVAIGVNGKAKALR